MKSNLMLVLRAIMTGTKLGVTALWMFAVFICGLVGLGMCLGLVFVAGYFTAAWLFPLM